MKRAPTDHAAYLAVGQRIRAVRRRARVSQGDLAKHIGLSRSSLANIEAGRQSAQLHWILRIADTLKVAPAQLLPEPGTGVSGEVMRLGDPELAVMTAIVALTPDQTRRVLNWARERFPS